MDNDLDLQARSVDAWGEEAARLIRKIAYASHCTIGEAAEAVAAQAYDLALADALERVV